MCADHDVLIGELAASGEQASDIVGHRGANVNCGLKGNRDTFEIDDRSFLV